MEDVNGKKAGIYGADFDDGFYSQQSYRAVVQR